MDETMSSTWGTNWNTTATTTSGTNAFTVSTDDLWFPYYELSTWLPYDAPQYKPKWHIKLGYKNQLKTMWE